MVSNTLTEKADVNMPKIRFYHWWLYRCFWRVWSPLLSRRPAMVEVIRDWATDWLEKQKDTQ